jgi:DNA (cytosine-5)-methyltransferase 1
MRLLHPFTAAEFFAGVGLARLGLEAAGGKVVWANDIEPVKQAVYAENFPAREYILGDVSAVPGDSLPTVDLAWASFPCTDLSLAGDRAGLEGDESGLVWEFLRVLEEMGPRRPRVVAVENVVGFVSSNGGRDVRESIAALNRLGYVCDAFVVDARWFVPQSRPRLFLVGWQDSIVVPVPEASVLERQFRPPQVMRLFSEANLQMRMGHLPQPEPRIARLDDIVERLPPDDPQWWGNEETRRCLAQMDPAHAERLRRLAASEIPRYATGYRRTRKAGVRTEVRDDGVAGCLRALRGGSSRQMLFECVGGDIRVRWLKAREYARLMGAPDSFAFGTATESQVMYAFGDAVCVDVVAWLTKHYLWALGSG